MRSQAGHNSNERPNFQSPHTLPEDPSYQLQEPGQSIRGGWGRAPGTGVI